MSSKYDVIVIGGGLTGTSILRECARRGWSALLVDREDLASGGTGGAGDILDPSYRRLPDPPETARQIAEEAARLRRIASPLVRPLPWITPADDPASMKLLSGFVSGTDPYARTAGLPDPERIGKAELRRRVPAISEAIEGAVAREVLWVDTSRLAVELAAEAAALGAEVRNHCRAESLLLSETHEVLGVKVTDVRGGEAEQIGARAVVNACGAWAGEWTPAPGGHVIRETRIVLEYPFGVIGVGTTAVDGQAVAVHPAGDLHIVGPVLRYHLGPPDEASANADEVDYLLGALQRVLPTLGEASLLRAEVRVHSAPPRWGVPAGQSALEISLAHHVDDGCRGLFSVQAPGAALPGIAARRVGRALAEHLGDEDRPPDPDASLPCSAENADPDVEPRLLARYGARAREIGAIVEEEPVLGHPVCVTDGISAAEILHAVRHEWASTLEDLRRRTGLASGACAGMDCCIGAAHLLGREDRLPFAALSPEVERFSRMRRIERGAVISRGNYAREEMARAVFSGSLGLEY